MVKSFPDLTYLIDFIIDTAIKKANGNVNKSKIIPEKADMKLNLFVACYDNQEVIHPETDKTIFL